MCHLDKVRNVRFGHIDRLMLIRYSRKVWNYQCRAGFAQRQHHNVWVAENWQTRFFVEIK